jgi:hypothetical protein
LSTGVRRQHHLDPAAVAAAVPLGEAERPAQPGPPQLLVPVPVAAAVRLLVGAAGAVGERQIGPAADPPDRLDQQLLVLGGVAEPPDRPRAAGVDDRRRAAAEHLDQGELGAQPLLLGRQARLQVERRALGKLEAGGEAVVARDVDEGGHQFHADVAVEVDEPGADEPVGPVDHDVGVAAEAGAGVQNPLAPERDLAALDDAVAISVPDGGPATAEEGDGPGVGRAVVRHRVLPGQGRSGSGGPPQARSAQPPVWLGQRRFGRRGPGGEGGPRAIGTRGSLIGTGEGRAYRSLAKLSTVDSMEASML